MSAASNLSTQEPLAQTDANSCTHVLISQWVSHFGLPLAITPDRGVQFTSQLWESMTKLYGTKLHCTTAYHPQANGLVERFHRHLKSALKAHLTGPNWMDELPWVLFKEDLGTSSAKMVFGSALTVPADFVPAPAESGMPPGQHLQCLRNTIGNLTPVPTSQHGTAHLYIPHTLQEAPFVFIRRDGHRRPLQAPYEGPYKVLNWNDKTFLVDIGGREDHFSVD